MVEAAADDMDTSSPPASGVASILPAGLPAAGADAMMEVKDLRTKRAWTNFKEYVRNAINGGVRPALSQHFTQACQPGKAEGVAGPSGSLKASGADNPHKTNGVHECHIVLKNLLEPGDGLVLDYVSEGKRSKRHAQEAAFVEVLSYILFRGPKHLRTHVNQWHADRLEWVIDYAAFRLRGNLGSRPRGQWSPLSVPNYFPGPRLPQRPTGLGGSCSAYTAPADGEDPAEREDRILGALRLVLRTRINQGTLPPNVWPVLDRELLRHGLRPFLQRLPDEFVIISESPLVWRRL